MIEQDDIKTQLEAARAGDWQGALRGYRYGYPGVRGERGQQYAAAVLSRCGGGK